MAGLQTCIDFFVSKTEKECQGAALFAKEAKGANTPFDRSRLASSGEKSGLHLQCKMQGSSGESVFPLNEIRDE